MNTTFLYQRFASERIQESMLDTPAVMLTGPRQAGKTTLVRYLARHYGIRYISLDDDPVREAATTDPVGLVRSFDRVVIDEIQRSPELILAIKKSIDDDRRPGRFLMTGSANLMVLPSLADSLAGRMERVWLYPLSQAEICSSSTNWVDTVFSGEIPAVTNPVIGSDLVEMVLRGGYPEAIKRSAYRRCMAWLQEYIDALILRDVKDIADIEKIEQMPRFMHALAHTSGQMCNYSRLGGQVGLNYKTAAKYIGIFEQMFILDRVPAWSSNHLNGLIKTPKLEFIDSGLLSCLLGVSYKSINSDKKIFGNILETFVYSELLKYSKNSYSMYNIYYYRDNQQNEIDFIIENKSGDIVCIELKASSTLGRNDFSLIRKFSDSNPDKFKIGILLYDGMEILPFGKNIWAVPLSTLW